MTPGCFFCFWPLLKTYPMDRLACFLLVTLSSIYVSRDSRCLSLSQPHAGFHALFFSHTHASAVVGGVSSSSPPLPPRPLVTPISHTSLSNLSGFVHFSIFSSAVRDNWFAFQDVRSERYTHVRLSAAIIRKAPSLTKKKKRNVSIMHFFSIPGVRVTCCCFFFRIRFVGPGVGSVKMEAPQADKVCKPDNTPVGSRRYRKKKQHDAIKHTPQLSSIKYRSWVYVVLAPNSTLHFCFHCCCSVTQKWITVLHNVQYPTGWEGMRQVRKKRVQRYFVAAPSRHSGRRICWEGGVAERDVENGTNTSLEPSTPTVIGSQR